VETGGRARERIERERERGSTLRLRTEEPCVRTPKVLTVLSRSALTEGCWTDRVKSETATTRKSLSPSRSLPPSLSLPLSRSRSRSLSPPLPSPLPAFSLASGKEHMRPPAWGPRVLLMASAARRLCLTCRHTHTRTPRLLEKVAEAQRAARARAERFGVEYVEPKLNVILSREEYRKYMSATGENSQKHSLPCLIVV
jgi:hypothetical protein